MVRGSPAATGYRPTRQTRGLYKGGSTSAACFGLRVYLIYALRHPLLAFLDSALDGNASMTVPAFITKWHGNDGRVRLLTASLTLVALTGLVLGSLGEVTTLRPGFKT
jgi:hypothetical protein